MNTGVLIFVIIISAAAGYAFAFFDRRFTQNVRQKAEENKKPAPPAPTPVQSPPPKPEEPAALRVLLDKNLRWQLELDGKQVEAPAITPEQRARLVNIIVQIRPWVDGKTALAAAPVPAPQPQPMPAAPAQPRINVRRGLTSLVNNDIKTMEKAKALSIVALIDEFLQKRLAVSPLAGQEIRMDEGPLGEVFVVVGKQRFPGVDAVPDPQIQALIREAISDWEKSS